MTYLEALKAMNQKRLVSFNGAEGKVKGLLIDTAKSGQFIFQSADDPTKKVRVLSRDVDFFQR